MFATVSRPEISSSFAKLKEATNGRGAPFMFAVAFKKHYLPLCVRERDIGKERECVSFFVVL